MNPVRVSIGVPQRREDVYDFLDLMSNHEPFTDHILKDWKYSGPERGIGSKAQVRVTAGGRTDTIEIEVVSAHRPETIVERNIGAGGKRIANGTYLLEQLPDGGTQIVFEYSWQQAPLSERIASPWVRGVCAAVTSARCSGWPNSSEQRSLHLGGSRGVKSAR